VHSVDALRAAVRASDPTVAIKDIRPMDDILGSSLAARRFAMALISAFAFVALALAAIGIYGVLAYSVTSRTREFGIRMALGATRQNVLTLVLRQAMTWSLIGLSLGAAGAFIAGRSLRAYLFGIQATDAVTFVAVASGLLAAVTMASLVPARRATRVDPMQAMREE
jgi:putative ABC transport system permease protein